MAFPEFKKKKPDHPKCTPVGLFFHGTLLGLSQPRLQPTFQKGIGKNLGLDRPPLSPILEIGCLNMRSQHSKFHPQFCLFPQNLTQFKILGCSFCAVGIFSRQRIVWRVTSSWREITPYGLTTSSARPKTTAIHCHVIVVVVPVPTIMNVTIIFLFCEQEVLRWVHSGCWSGDQLQLAPEWFKGVFHTKVFFFWKLGQKYFNSEGNCALFEIKMFLRVEACKFDLIVIDTKMYLLSDSLFLSLE